MKHAAEPAAAVDAYQFGRPEYRPDIDGLRAVAVIAVVLFHVSPSHLQGGFVGVDVFFVISGFLISRIVLNGLCNGSFTYGGFYARRIKRLFPALTVVLAASIAIGWAVALPVEFAALGKHVLASAAFAANFVFWSESGYFDTGAGSKPLLHLWSLGVEEQYYLFWPLILVVLHRSQHTMRWIAALTAASFGLNVFLTGYSASAAFYLPFTRFWELLIGAALACHIAADGIRQWRPAVRSASSILGFGMILTAVVFTAGAFPGWWALLPAVGTGMLIAAGPDAFVNRSLLSRRSAVATGLISYPLYLWHWPLLTFGRFLGWRSHAAGIALVILAVLLSWITYRWIEAPLRFGHPARWKLPVLLSALGIAGVTGFAIYRSEGSVAYLGANTLAADLKDTSGAYHQPCSGTPSQIEPQLNLCRETPHSPRVAAIFGDSHADSVFHGIAQADTRRGWLLIGNSSCPPVNGVSVKFRRDTTNLLQCQERSEAATRYLLGDSMAGTVVLAFFGGYFLSTDVAADHLQNGYGPSAVSITSAETNSRGKRALFFYGIERTIATLLNAGKKVALMVDTPELPFFPRDAIQPWFPGRPALPVKSVLNRQRELRAEVEILRSRYPRLIVFDPLDALCARDECRVVAGNVLMYRDSHHLSTRGSKVVAEKLLATLDLALR